MFWTVALREERHKGNVTVLCRRLLDPRTVGLFFGDDAVEDLSSLLSRITNEQPSDVFVRCSMHGRFHALSRESAFVCSTLRTKLENITDGESPREQRITTSGARAYYATSAIWAVSG